MRSGNLRPGLSRPQARSVVLNCGNFHCAVFDIARDANLPGLNLCFDFLGKAPVVAKY
jgi:hypothetical protein